MKENGLSSIRSKYASLEKREPQHIQDAIKSRRLYNETRGTQFQSDTMVVRNRNVEAQPNAPQPAARRAPQSTMGIFSSSSSGGRSGGKSYSSFFDRMLKDAQSGGDPSANRQKAGSSSWVKGMSNSASLSSDKRDALERQLKRVAQMELASKQPGMAPLQGEVQTVQSVPSQEPAAAEPLQPFGAQIPDIISEQPAHAAVQEPLMDVRAVRAALAQPANRALFSSIRGRIGNLIMHDLPADVTGELRQIARELDQLNSSTNS